MQVVNHTIAIDQKHTSRQRVIKIGARVVRHARAITCQLAEVAVTGPMVRAILAAIRRLASATAHARDPRSKPKLNESGRTGLPAALKNTAAGR